MGVEQTFTPREIMDDWTRFRGSWVQFVNTKTGKDVGGGLVELQGVDIADRARSWASASVQYKDKAGMMHGWKVMPTGARVRFAPKWEHKGYSMVHIPRSEWHGKATEFVWVSMVPVRQYRYGLSVNAFESRATHSVYRLGHKDRTNFLTMAHLWDRGSQFVAADKVDLSVGAAISHSIGIHPMVEGVGAICWNAKSVIGFYTDGKLLIEQRSRPLALSIAETGAIEYVETTVLTDFYKSTVLPRKVRTSPKPTPDYASPRLRGGPSFGSNEPPRAGSIPTPETLIADLQRAQRRASETVLYRASDGAPNPGRARPSSRRRD
jgi:ribosomal protein L35AE/L33A